MVFNDLSFRGVRKFGKFRKFQTPKSFGISGFQNKSSAAENFRFPCEKFRTYWTK